MSPRLSNGIPIRIGNRGFLADSKRYRACLPCSVAGTREVCQDTPLPKPNGWFCPGSHFFLFLFFEHFMHMCIIDLGHFTSHFSLPTLLNPFSSSQVPLLFLCPIVGLLYIELRIACMSKGGGFFLLESIGNLPVFQQSRKPHQVAILQLQPWPWSTSPITCVLKQSF